MILRADSHERTGEWVRERIPKVASWLPGFKTIRAQEGGQILGAVVFDGFTPFDVNMHIAIEDYTCVNRRAIRAVFAFPFEQLGLKRVTALIAESNIASQKFVRRLGFALEGRKLFGFGDEDELIFGMTREACQWL